MDKKLTPKSEHGETSFVPPHEFLQETCATAERLIEESRAPLRTIHTGIDERRKMLHDRVSPRQRKEITDSFAAFKKRLIGLDGQFTAQIRILKLLQSTLAGDQLSRVKDLTARLQELSRDAQRFVRSIDEALAPRDAQVAEREQLQIWTGDKIKDWFSDMRVGDRIVSDSGTERELVQIIGPYLYFSMRKHDEVSEKYYEPETGKLTIAQLIKNMSAIRFIERRLG